MVTRVLNTEDCAHPIAPFIPDPKVAPDMRSGMLQVWRLGPIGVAGRTLFIRGGYNSRRVPNRGRALDIIPGLGAYYIQGPKKYIQTYPSSIRQFQTKRVLVGPREWGSVRREGGKVRRQAVQGAM